MKHIIIFLLCISTFLYAQENHKLGPTVVIASSGIKIRSKPSTSASVVTRAAYGDPITVTAISQLDSLDIGYREIRGGNKQERKLVANWLQVKYQGKTGYVFGPLLSSPDSPPVFPADQEIILFYEGVDCNIHMHHPTVNYHWYGVYPKGDQYEIREVKIYYYELHDMLPFRAIDTDQEEVSSFIIGSKKQLKTGRVDKPALSGGGTISWEQAETISGGELKWSAHRVGEGEEYNGYVSGEGCLKVWEAGEWQQLPMADYDELEGELSYFEHIEISAAGDFDGDGKMDFLVKVVQGEMSSHDVLYLSSQAKGKLSWGLAAFYWWGMCC